MAALTTMDDPRAVDALIAGLKVGDPRIQTEVAEMLGKKRDSRSVEPRKGKQKSRPGG